MVSTKIVELSGFGFAAQRERKKPPRRRGAKSQRELMHLSCSI